MISLSILNKMILSLLSLCLLGGCQKNPKTTHVPDTSLATDTAEVEYYNSTKAPEWTWREGIKMDGYLLTSDAEHTMESTILNGSRYRNTQLLDQAVDKRSGSAADLRSQRAAGNDEADQPDAPGRRNFAGNGAADES